MKMNLTLIGLIMTIGFTSCEKDLIEYRQGDIKVCVEQGQVENPGADDPCGQG